jgi:hypothetical protein
MFAAIQKYMAEGGEVLYPCLCNTHMCNHPLPFHSPVSASRKPRSKEAVTRQNTLLSLLDALCDLQCRGGALKPQHAACMPCLSC